MARLPFLILVACVVVVAAGAFSWMPPPPTMGIGAILFKPRGLSFRPSLGEEEDLVDAGKFFTDAFWTAKVGGGAKKLSPSQTKSIERQQILEFRRRYGKRLSRQDRRSELILCSTPKGDIVGCAGIEVDSIKKMDGRDSTFRAPLMSNLAVGRSYRRRGIAEDLVKAAEDLARKEWGFEECYLYVEKRNGPAVKLYRKLGYRPIWEDEKAKTLVPTESGKVENARTVIVCMKKRFSGLSRFLSF